MAQVTLDLSFARAKRTCRVVIGPRLLEHLPLDQFSDASSIAIISDDVVSRIYGDRLRKQMTKVAKTHLITFPHGEKSKTLSIASKICTEMNARGLDRKSAIIALGGGVVGDLAGFVASIFKRGLKYFQAPTTLLAQVDSSIGGKTAVDAQWGKNQLGSFYQPAGVFIDPSTLDTLPEEQTINGLCEMVKSGIIADRALFRNLSSRLEKNAKLSIEELKPFIKDACKVKIDIVQRDEFETNLRSILNYGHTVGHAIEASSNFSLSHGKSVLLGMLCEGWISKNLGIFSREDWQHQEDLLSDLRRAYSVSASLNQNRILSFAKLDKKTLRGEIRMSLPEKIGKMYRSKEGNYTVPISKELFVASLENLRREIS